MTEKHSVTAVLIFTGHLMHISLDSAVTSWKIMMSHSAVVNIFLMIKSVLFEKKFLTQFPKQGTRQSGI